MPGWAWVVIVIAVPLIFGKLYDLDSKRRGHRPGKGEEPLVDYTHYQPPLPPMGGPPSG